jgi:putative transposase
VGGRITYIRILTGFSYLAAILDRHSRKVVCWAISRRIDTELCLRALKTALARRQLTRGCLHHLNRGVQYCSADYVAALNTAGMEISMSRTGNPYSSAHMESFFKTLKYGEVHLANYETIEDVIERLPHFIAEVYK